MTIQIDCPGCFKQYKLKPEFAGKKIRCKDCGETITIADPHDDIDEFEEDEFEAPSPHVSRRPKQTSAGSGKWFQTMFGRGGKVWTQWGIFLLLCIVGYFIPKPMSFVMFGWGVVSLVVVFTGLLWLAKNCFESAPFDAIIMVLLPFVGFIGASSRIDLFNERNERPFRMAWRGLWSFLAALVAAMVLTGISQNRPAVANNPAPAPNPNLPPHMGPRDPNLMPVDPLTGRNQVLDQPAKPQLNPSPDPIANANPNQPRAFTPPGNQPRPVDPNRTFPFRTVYEKLPDNSADLTAKLDATLSEFPFYVKGSLQIVEAEKRLIVHFNEPVKPELFRQVLEKLSAGGVEFPLRQTTSNNPRIGKFTPGPFLAFKYTELPGTPEETVTKLQERLKEFDWVDTEQISIIPTDGEVVIKLTDNQGFLKRNELIEPIKSTGVKLK